LSSQILSTSDAAELDQLTSTHRVAAPLVTGAEQLADVNMAYLVSQYPAISHTFILREVLHLRSLGAQISVCSVNDPDRDSAGLTAEERDEVSRTYYLKAHGAVGALAAMLKTLLTRPFGFVAGLGFAFGLAGTDIRKFAYSLFYFIEAMMLGQWMQRKEKQHVHVHFATPASTVAQVAARIFPISYSMTVHGPDEFYDAPGYKLAEKIRDAAFICCIGTYSRSQLMKLSAPHMWDKFEVSPLGVDAEKFAPQSPPESPTFEVICVGRLVPAKGQHILLQAIDHMVSAGRDVRLRVVGNGPDMDSLQADARRRGIEKHVVFEGAVNQDRIRELYSRAHAFALASFAEGIPVVLMEAMAMEIPCVTTFITGHPELIRHGVDGLLVAPSDDEELADALSHLMDNPKRRAALGKAGRLRVQDKYHLQRNAARLGEIFKRRQRTLRQA